MIHRSGRLFVFIGTYTRLEPHLVTANGKGIYVYELDPATGALIYRSEIHGIVNPSFLTIDAERKRLFATSEIDQSEEGGVSSYVIDPNNGTLSHLSTQQAGGSAACYVSADESGNFVLTSNYSTGNVAVFPLAADGRLQPAHHIVQHAGSGPNADRQEGPHAHCIVIDPTRRFAFAADLGVDQIIGYRISVEDVGYVKRVEDWKLMPHSVLDLAAGSGPRHIVFHPNGKLAYVIQELDSTITAMGYDDSAGRLSIIETVPALPAGFAGESHCADLHVSPCGRFLYGSNRGHDSIVMFRIDADSGRLTLLGHEPTGGNIPRNFAIDPTGTFLLAANQDSDTVVTFRIDGESGLLSSTGHVANVPTPVCLKMAVF